MRFVNLPAMLQNELRNWHKAYTNNTKLSDFHRSIWTEIYEAAQNGQDFSSDALTMILMCCLYAESKPKLFIHGLDKALLEFFLAIGYLKLLGKDYDPLEPTVRYGTKTYQAVLSPELQVSWERIEHER